MSGRVERKGSGIVVVREWFTQLVYFYFMSVVGEAAWSERGSGAGTLAEKRRRGYASSMPWHCEELRVCCQRAPSSRGKTADSLLSRRHRVVRLSFVRLLLLVLVKDVVVSADSDVMCSSVFHLCFTCMLLLSFSC